MEIEDALNSLVETYNDLNPPVMDVLDHIPTALEFLRYVARNTPFVIRGGAESWSAYKKWSLSYLQQKLADHQVKVAITPDGLADALHHIPTSSISNNPLTPIPVQSDNSYQSLFIEPYEEEVAFPIISHQIVAQSRTSTSAIKNSNSTDEVQYCQSQNSNLNDEYTPLLPDLPPTISWADEALNLKPDALNFWFGNEKSLTKLHRDNYENIYAQIRGGKRFVLLPPSAVHIVKEKEVPRARWIKTSQNDKEEVIEGSKSVKRNLEVEIIQPLEYIPVPTIDVDKHFEREGLPINPTIVELQEGDMMYLPALWYHQVSQTNGHEGFSCSVNYW